MSARRYAAESVVVAIGLAAAGLVVGVGLALRAISDAVADVWGLS